MQQRPDAGDDPVQIDRLRVHPLLAGEGQQLRRQARAPLGRGHGGGQRSGEPLVRRLDPCLEQFEIAEDCGQQIVEIVRHAGGQLPDRLDALCLPQLRLGLFALVDLRREPAVGGFEFGGALGDPPFEQGVGLAHVVDIDRSAEPEHDLAVDPDRPVADAMPAIGAVMPPQAGLDGEFRAGCEGLGARPVDPVAVLRRVQRRTVRRGRPERPADIVAHLLVVVLGDAVRPDDKGDVGQRIDHQAQTLLALPQLRLGAPAVLDVAIGDDEPAIRRLVGVERHPAVADRRRPGLDMFGAPGCQDPQIGLIRLAVRDLGEHLEQGRPRISSACRFQKASAVRLANRMRWSRSIAYTASPIASSTSASRRSEARTASLASRPTRAIARCSPTRDKSSRAPNGFGR